MTKIGIIIPLYEAQKHKQVIEQNLKVKNVNFYLTSEIKDLEYFNFLKDKFKLHNNIRFIDKTIYHKKGASHSRNLLLDHVEEKYVINLDQDDLLIESGIEELQRIEGEYDLIFTPLTLEKNNIKIKKRTIIFKSRILNLLLIYFYYPPRICTVVFNTKKLKALHGFPLITSGGEEWLLFRKLFEKKLSFYQIQKSHTLKIENGTNLSNTHKKDRLRSLEDIVLSNSSHFQILIYKLGKIFKK
ncbi:hypothetical protein [Nonlabens sp.]|uniref:hypothetical protein n=1 Tax=Nonlabens sp. TaxID=1888209 RepID=UPI001BD0A35C|nr:hypothetical protein [Nonlabens sp.]